MHRLAITLAAGLAFLTLAITHRADRAEAPLDRLAWLAGDWRMASESGSSQEA